MRLPTNPSCGSSPAGQTDTAAPTPATPAAPAAAASTGVRANARALGARIGGSIGSARPVAIAGQVRRHPAASQTAALVEPDRSPVRTATSTGIATAVLHERPTLQRQDGGQNLDRVLRQGDAPAEAAAGSGVASLQDLPPGLERPVLRRQANYPSSQNALGAVPALDQRPALIRQDSMSNIH